MSDSILDHMNASRPLLSKFEHISQLKSVEGISLISTSGQLENGLIRISE
jgi:hypothetical protein